MIHIKTNRYVWQRNHTTSLQQLKSCEPFVYFKIAISIDYESPINYEQLYAQIVQKLKDE